LAAALELVEASHEGGIPSAGLLLQLIEAGQAHQLQLLDRLGEPRHGRRIAIGSRFKGSGSFLEGGDPIGQTGKPTRDAALHGFHCGAELPDLSRAACRLLLEE
jgi:hypothetical protein